MGIPDRSLLDLIEKVGSCVSWGASDLSCLSGEFRMPDNGQKMCCQCNMSFSQSGHGYGCQSCGRMLCGKCVLCYGYNVVKSEGLKSDAEAGNSIKSCKYCTEVSPRHEGGRKSSDKVHPSISPRDSPEPPSPCFSGENESVQSDRLALYLEAQVHGYSPHALTSSSVTSFSAYPSPISVRRSPSRSDEEEAENSTKHFFSSSNEFYHDVSDIDSSSVSVRNEFYSKSVGSSPSDSPSRINCTSNRLGSSVQQGQEASPISRTDSPYHQETMAIFGKPELGTEDLYGTDDDLSIFGKQYKKSQKPLDFEKNGLMWYPPPPDDEDDEAEGNFFEYDDEDDEIGDSGAMFSSSMFPAKEKQNESNKEPLRAVIQGHFRALVSELLQAEGLKVGKEHSAADWLDIVSTIAWQAANFVKPDTSGGGSMDPGDYVKVKCSARGRPSESTLIKGIVCTKNIKHKRMISQYKNPRLLLLGGALEYQRAPNQLSSFNTLLQQENDYFKMIISKIEALRPNVLLVERSVSSYAQEYLLAKEISLVLNVKRSLMERIARCTGALITPSIDNVSNTRLGHCELFRLERVSEEHEPANQLSKKPSKTLMFFEGCPRRLGCTVLLRGMCREELKKVKHVVQYAIFAAYHLSLETSFLADEGASLPKMTSRPSVAIPDRIMSDNSICLIPDSVSPTNCPAGAVADASAQDEGCVGLILERGRVESSSDHIDPGHISPSSPGNMDSQTEIDLSDAYDDDSHSLNPCEYLKETTELPSDIRKLPQPQMQEIMTREERQGVAVEDLTKSETVDNDISSKYLSASDTHQSILVSFSCCHVLKGTVCERSRLLRIKFYGCFDKPLGRYLRNDLFNEISRCQSCDEPAEGHVQCYTHQRGNLTINAKRLSSLKLPGERDGKIWMWHRCLRCSLIDGVPPATRRVVMSDAAWGLSFGKFLELSFSNHATANRVAPCGHSLQKDCLRYYGFGSMVAFFRYSPIDILSVQLPPSVLEFSGDVQQEWMRTEVAELTGTMETFYAEISDVLDNIEHKSKSLRKEVSDITELHNHIMELKNLLEGERNDYRGLLHPASIESPHLNQKAVDILELNRLRRSLVIGSHAWDRQLYSLDSLVKTNSCSTVTHGNASYVPVKELTRDSSFENRKCDFGHEENVSESSKLHDSTANDLQSELRESFPRSSEFSVPDASLSTSHHHNKEDMHLDGCSSVNNTDSESIPFHASNLSERIDSAWTGDQVLAKAKPFYESQADEFRSGPVRQISESENPPFRRLMSPVRVHSFDSALKFHDRRKGLPPSSLHLSTPRSLHALGDYSSMVRDPSPSMIRTYSQVLPWEAQKLNLVLNSEPSFISSASHIADGARLLLPQTGSNNIVIAVYENEPTSIISYALSTKEYEDWVADKSNETESCQYDSPVSNFSAQQSFGSLDLDYIRHAEDASASMSTLSTDPKRSPHVRITFVDESAAGGRVKFSITSYFAKQFDVLRKKCCPNEVDFIRSLGRSKRWSAQGGKSKVYFAKSLDERFIVKQVTKTELESFEDFATEYFKYLTDSLSSGSPTCLAKILGMYQVSIKYLKGSKETKMDLMVMENLFFGRSISRVYDLKGSARSRYNPNTTGKNNVLLDTNLVETLRTDPIFLGFKAKRSLERAIWNDTSFLASVDVMDYSLLVGVDEQRKELVLGIIDFMRQYTWDKHLETWVKASGILGGKNASPTIISPKQYKKRFRKAMTTYFLTVPDQWTS